MKKLLVLVLAMSLGLSMVACGNKNNDEVQDDVVIESTEDNNEEIVGNEFADDEVVEDEFADDEYVEEEFVMPTISEELQPLRDAVANALGENYWPSSCQPLAMYEHFGLTEDMLDDYFIESPMIGFHIDTLMVLKPAEGRKDDVLAFTNNYVAYQQDEMNQYPSNVGKGASVQVAEVGDYVVVAMLGGMIPGAENGDEVPMETQVAHCQAANEAAIEAIKGVVNQ